MAQMIVKYGGQPIGTAESDGTGMRVDRDVMVFVDHLRLDGVDKDSAWASLEYQEVPAGGSGAVRLCDRCEKRPALVNELPRRQTTFHIHLLCVPCALAYYVPPVSKTVSAILSTMREEHERQGVACPY